MSSNELSLSYLESLEMPLGTLHKLKRISNGFSNDNYLLTASSGNYRLRVPQFTNNFDQLKAEQMILNWASKKSDLIVPLLDLFKMNKFSHVSVFPYIEADPKFDLYNEQLMCNAGQALAEYHLAVSEYKGNLPLESLSKSFSLDTVEIDALRNVINQQTVSDCPSFWNAVENLLSRIKKVEEKLNEHPYISLPLLPCHGDYAPANLLALKNAVIGIIDFECCRWAPRVYDISLFLLSLQQGEEYGEFMSTWFLNGYQSIISLSDVELESIPIFQLIRSLESAKRHFNKIIQGEHQVNTGLVMYWDRITSELK